MHTDSVFAITTLEGFTMAKQANNLSSPRPGRRWAIAAAAAMVIAAGSWTGLSQAQAAGESKDPRAGGHYQMHGERGEMTPERSAKRIDRMIERLLSDGTPEQKAKVRTLANAAATDLMPLRKQRREAHQQGMTLLAQPSVDRAALEQVRATEMQLDDQTSKRMTSALADIAEVLTPAQRVRVAEQLAQRGKHHGGHHGGHRAGHDSADKK
jgi:protein CpxP